MSSAPVAGPSLVIEASTYRGTVAIVTADRVVADQVVAMRGEHSEALMPAVAQALRSSGIGIENLETIICGAGPGSFTSLRLAAAIAKGLTGARVVQSPRPLASVSSLALIVAGARGRLEDGLYLATLDALRGERYGLLVERTSIDGEAHGVASVRSIGPWRRLRDAEMQQWARDAGAHLIGPGCPIDAWPQAAGVVSLWPEVISVDAVAWEPDYGRLAEAEVRRSALLSAQARR